MAQIQIKGLLGKANYLLEKGFNFFGMVFIKKSEMEEILDEIADAIPTDIHEAEIILRRKEELLQEGQARAERIIQEAKEQQDRMVNDNEVLRRVEDELKRRQQEVLEECSALRNSAYREAEDMKYSAQQKTEEMMSESENYAEAIFDDLDTNIEAILTRIKQCKTILAEKRAKREIPQNSDEQEE